MQYLFQSGCMPTEPMLPVQRPCPTFAAQCYTVAICLSVCHTPVLCRHGLVVLLYQMVAIFRLGPPRWGVVLKFVSMKTIAIFGQYFALENDTR